MKSIFYLFFKKYKNSTKKYKHILPSKYNKMQIISNYTTYYDIKSKCGIFFIINLTGIF